MIHLVVPATPLRSERYRRGMSTLLGRRVMTFRGVTSCHPHTPRHHLVDGVFAVEMPDGSVSILTHAEYHARLRPAERGGVMTAPGRDFDPWAPPEATTVRPQTKFSAEEHALWLLTIASLVVTALSVAFLIATWWAGAEPTGPMA